MIDRGGSRRTASAVGYPQGRAWGKARLGRTPATIVHPMAWAVLCGLGPSGSRQQPSHAPGQRNRPDAPGPA